MASLMTYILSFPMIFLTLGISSFSQSTKPDVTDDEESEARAVAVAFFADYGKERDLKPLLRKYFVSDFERRLEFCRVTDQCQGFARDFWKLNAILAEQKPSRNDYLQHYIAVTNTIYLCSALLQHIAQKDGKSLSDYSDSEYERILTDYLSNRSRKNFAEIFASDNVLGGLTSIKALRKRIAELEKLVSELRLAERKARQKLKQNPRERDPQDFRVGDDVNTGRFFDYPRGTKLFDIWPKDHHLPFKLDMILEGGRMKIVAIYIPMD